MAPFVQTLMYIMAPVAWPTAKLLDYLLGEDHGTVYKKAGLKTLVSLHRSLGEAGQQLNADEVTIISAVLDLKDKSVGRIMTPMDDVFTLSLDDVLDEVTMDDILSQGYSRIPIHHPDNNSNFIGMLLVKMLITYDPEDAKPVRDFALATLPETRPDTSCLDIVNFFQEGKSHMVLVSEYPGDDHGAIGVVTLEDVIEELIGEEIVDESDVFIDVHKAIRRAMPAPTRRISRHLTAEQQAAPPPATDLVDIREHDLLSPDDLQQVQTADTLGGKPKGVSALRRHSSASNIATDLPRVKRAATDEIMEHLKHLGPSNLASRPKATRYSAVKIKPGTEATTNPSGAVGVSTPVRRISESTTDYHGGIGEGVLKSGGKGASDAVQALQYGYGAISSSPIERRPQSATKGIQADLPSPDNSKVPDGVHNTSDRIKPVSKASSSTIGSLPDTQARPRSPYYHSKGPARSGSITENIVDTNGFRKVVLETTSSSESNEEEDNSGANKGHPIFDSGKGSNANRSELSLRAVPAETEDATNSSSKKKKRRRRKRGNGTGETEPLLK
jgi:metal transporter CNNM